MLEGLVTWVLSNYVGEYLENLNADQISIALLQGQVELENVPIKKTALQKFDIPVEVRSGVIGKLTLSVPITRIRSEPWVLKMSDLLVLLGPNTHINNVEAVDQYEQNRKELMLEELEKVHRRSLMTAARLEAKISDTESAWWGASFLSTVSNNIQLILDNVHIRYEDDRTMPDKVPFHFGFRIQNISIQTTNSHWKPGFVQPEDGVNIFKKLDIKGLSVFWNCTQEIHHDVLNAEDLKRILSPLTTKNNTYLLKPFSMQARMERNSSKFPLKQQPCVPRFKFDLRPEMIELELSKRQLAQIRVLSTEWSRFDRARQHRKWRPLTQVNENAKDWWQFAYERIREDNRKQRTTASTTYVMNRAKMLNTYCRSYHRRLRAYVADQLAKHQKSLDPSAKVAPASAANPEDVAYMKQIEHDSQFSYHELQLFRETVFRKYMRELEEQNPKSEEPEVFELVSPDSDPPRNAAFNTISGEASVEMSELNSPDQTTPQSGGGLYGWIASWFGGSVDSTSPSSDPDTNRAALLDMWPEVEERQLPPNLRKVEKHIEEELLDVLSESWDDSTVLRRDTLLAELVLQLEQMIIRFVDDDEQLITGRSRILALDMRDVASRVLLSPREHRTEVSLSVGDMSCQRLRIVPHLLEAPQTSSAAHSPVSRQESFDELAEADSLLYGATGGSKVIDTEVLFAVGRTKEYEFDAERSASEEQKPRGGSLNTTPLASPSQSVKPEPLLQLFYRRSAPRLNIFHEVKGTFLPISIVYDEDALDGLRNLFDTDSAFFDPNAINERNAKMASSREYDPNVQLYLTLAIPEVNIELRTKHLRLAAPPLEESAAFASAKFSGVSLMLSQTERYLSRLKLGFESVLLSDLYEKTEWPLIRTNPPTTVFSHSLRPLSNSTPDLAQSSSGSLKSPPRPILVPRSAITPKKDFLAGTSLPSEVQELNALHNADLRSNRSSAGPRSSSTLDGETVDGDFGQSVSNAQVVFDFTFADEKHPHFDGRFQKQHCLVKAIITDGQLGMNRRTWTMLLNFFGALGQKPATSRSGTASPTTTKTDDLKDVPSTVDPVLEALLRGGKVPESDVLASLKRSESDKIPRPAVAPYILRLQMEFADLAVAMNFPANGTRLGTAVFADTDFDLRINLNDPEEPMRIDVKVAEFSLLDTTPFYSRLYSERCSLRPTNPAAKPPSSPHTASTQTDTSSGSSHSPTKDRHHSQSTPKKPKKVQRNFRRPQLRVDILKYRTDDLELKRKYDVRVDVESGRDTRIAYVHTHRYFCAFLDFWLNFADLQDRVRRMNERIGYAPDQQKTRCLLNVNLDTPLSLILPLNQLSDQCICIEADSVKTTNKFQLGSQVAELAEHAIESLKLDGDDYDCLLEVMRVECQRVRCYAARRMKRQSVPPKRSKATRATSAQPDTHPVSGHRIADGAFEDVVFGVEGGNVLSREFPLIIDIYRNLSSFISHNLPEMSIITHFADLELHFSTDFYKLLRGFLEKNLGDALIPVPETIPMEILQSPERDLLNCTGTKYVTFSNRMVFHNVIFHFLTPREKRFVPLARIMLHKARISFDAFIDNQSELDLICESTELHDSRYDSLPANQRPNIFTTIITPRQQPKVSAGNGVGALMSEAHIMMRKDEAPIVTLVLLNARVLLILDWLNMAKDFVLLNTEFVAPEEKPDLKAVFGTPKDGVLVRNPSTARHLSSADSESFARHTITLKITLKESDLVLLEQPSQSNSMALVAHTTAVLNLTDAAGVLEANFEVQGVAVSWCVMSAQHSTECQITNEFHATAQMSRDIPTHSVAGARGLTNLEIFGPRQTLKFELGEVVARVSYRDLLVVAAVVKGSLSRLHLNAEGHPLSNTELMDTTSAPKHSNASHLHPLSASSDELSTSSRHSDVDPHAPPPNAPINIKSVALNAPHVCVWFLDDSQGVTLPLIRALLTNLHAQHSADKVESGFVVGVDYFNQRIFGWEPLVEPWSIDSLVWMRSTHSSSLRIQSAVDCPFNLNLTQTFIQQAKHFGSKWADIRRALESDLRTMCVRSRSDHLPYLMRNQTGSSLIFTTAVDELQKARIEHRKSSAKWFTALPDKSCTFEFPAKLLVMRDKTADPRRVVIRVEGWDEISPVSVDSVGTYFRVARASTARNQHETSAVFARIVIAVSMEPDGRKVVTVRSALMVSNQLADPLQLIFTYPNVSAPQHAIMRVDPSHTVFAPLNYVNANLHVRPMIQDIEVDAERIRWVEAKSPGDSVNKFIRFGADRSDSPTDDDYWVCLALKHELYPEHDSPLCGHSLFFIPPLNVLNLLPTDLEFTCNQRTHTIQAGQRLQTATVNLEKELVISLATDRFHSQHSSHIQRNSLSERTDGSESRRILIRMRDQNRRELHVYASVSLARGGALNVALWVPFWIVNRSGIPLVIKQEAADYEAAGQVTDHEKAKDRNPLMFSFSDESCPTQCIARVGNAFADAPGFRPKFSRHFSLTPGVQAIQLVLTHDELATRVYNIGVEVRQGTGRYKDTQVVIFAPRYRLNNRSAHELRVCHGDEIHVASKHVRLAAKCNLIWHENFEDKRQLCVRREELPHWSCPFRIDQIGSFHVTMRDRDETPRFVRVEVTLQSASFWVTFTDASYYPAPIQIENRSNVPVLYHQCVEPQPIREGHFRTICKANSIVDYAWDDLYASKLLTLQVYENKSHTYDPSKPSQGPPLIYDNYIYIQYYSSFKRHSDISTDEPMELVIMARKEGKVQLGRMTPTDSSQSQLWLFTPDQCLENVGFNHRASTASGQRYVLDVLESAGGVLMMCARDPQRTRTQRWRFTNDGRLRCGIPDRYVEVRGLNLALSAAQAPDAPPLPIEQLTSRGIPKTQLFRSQRQKPGSGRLDVQCLHVGPTLVVRIVDKAEIAAEMQSAHAARRRRRSNSPNRSQRPPVSPNAHLLHSDEVTLRSNWAFEAHLEMPAGIGVSVVNNQCEELIYARLKGVELTVQKHENTYRLNGHVGIVQADNQLLTAERWPVLYCEANALKGDTADSELSSPSSTAASALIQQNRAPSRPALKLEMSWTPMDYYDAFDCFRLKVCDMCLLLDETWMWKLAHFIQETETAQSVQPTALLQPPNIEPDAIAETDSPIRRCYFGTLELEFGSLALSASTVPKNSLSVELKRLREQFNVKLISFENASVILPAFRQFHYFETLNFLVESLSKFYIAEIRKQTLNIVVTMDAFGNPLGLISDIKESAQGLVFEGDLGGFVSGLGYGITNSISKVASSAAQGVGALTFDEQHEIMRRRMLRSQTQNEGGSTALSHLYGGVKGLGVGVFGGFTALAKNAYTGTQQDGFTGFVRGMATGSVDTVTKPIQGVFDFVGGAASALKDAVGGPMVRRSYFPEIRVRPPRVCTSLQSLLPCYDFDAADAQQELLRINGYSTTEILLDVVVFLTHVQNGERITQRALICSEQCYILRQIGMQPSSVIQRIVYRQLKNIQPSTMTQSGLVAIETVYEHQPVRKNSQQAHIWCTNREVAARLVDKVLSAKQLYDHSKRTLMVTVEDVEQL